MLDEIHSFAKQHVSFAFETTLSGRSYLSVLRRLKTEGYEIHTSFCLSRVSSLPFQEYKNESREVDMAAHEQAFTRCNAITD